MDLVDVKSATVVSVDLGEARSQVGRVKPTAERRHAVDSLFAALRQRGDLTGSSVGGEELCNVRAAHLHRQQHSDASYLQASADRTFRAPRPKSTHHLRAWVVESRT